MNSFAFKLEGKPTPWKRAGRNGKRTYSTQTKVKDDIGFIAKSAMSNVDFPYCHKGTAVELKVYAGFALPKTLRKGDTRKIGGWHTQKPDGDNLLKLIKDALTGIVWDDDCQVSVQMCYKIWFKHGSTEVFIRVL